MTADKNDSRFAEAEQVAAEKTASRIASVLGLIWALPWVAWPPLLIPGFVAQQLAQFADDGSWGTLLFNLGVMALIGGVHFSMGCAVGVAAARELVRPHTAAKRNEADATAGSSSPQRPT